MYRLCQECNNGRGRRLSQGEMECPHQHDAIVSILEAGDLLGPFRITQALDSGDGGYAKVYHAEPLVAGYPPAVALKVAAVGRRAVLESEATNLASLGAAGVRQVPRIYPIPKEHQAASLDSPGATNAFVGTAVLDMEPFYFLALEYIEGITLRDLLAEKEGKGLAADEALRLAQAIGEALGEVHRRHYAHLDLKPANIMLRSHPTGSNGRKPSKNGRNGKNGKRQLTGEVALIDFGSATRLDTGSAQAAWSGTAPYAPREQLSQDYPDQRADIHALGITLFEMLTGKLPYRGESATALASAVMSSDPKTVASINPRLEGLDEVMGRAIHPDADQRYRSVEQLLADLGQAAGTTRVVPTAGYAAEVSPPPARASVAGGRAGRALVLGGGGLFLSVVIAAAFLMWPRSGFVADRCPPMCPPTPTATRPADEVFNTPVPAQQGQKLLIAMDLREPPVGKAYVGDDLPVLAWSDPNGGLVESELYLIILEWPNKETHYITSDDPDYHLGRDKLGVPGGTYRWQVVRTRGLDREIISYSSGIRTFSWVDNTPATSIPPPAPTNTAPPAPPTSTAAVPATEEPSPELPATSTSTTQAEVRATNTLRPPQATSTSLPATPKPPTIAPRASSTPIIIITQPPAATNTTLVIIPSSTPPPPPSNTLVVVLPSNTPVVLPNTPTTQPPSPTSTNIPPTNTPSTNLTATAAANETATAAARETARAGEPTPDYEATANAEATETQIAHIATWSAQATINAAATLTARAGIPTPRTTWEPQVGQLDAMAGASPRMPAPAAVPARASLLSTHTLPTLGLTQRLGALFSAAQEAVSSGSHRLLDPMMECAPAPPVPQGAECIEPGMSLPLRSSPAGVSDRRLEGR